MNRRHYLKQMGLSAAAIAGTRLEAFAQSQPHRENNRQQKRRIDVLPDESILNWNITPDRPSPNAFVTAIFAGLMAFSYNRIDDVGNVGFHEGDQASGSHSHNLTVTIYEINSVGQCNPRPPKQQPVILPNTRYIGLRVVPTSTAPVTYYQSSAPFDRMDSDRYDFRWLPDLDSADFYPENYPCYDSNYPRWLRVKNATFYTRMRTNSTFNLVTQEDDVTPNRVIKDFGHVARYMGAAIPLQDLSQYVELQVGAAVFPLRSDTGLRYQIHFHNECSSCTMPSNDDLMSSDEKRRNDFHFARKALRLPNDRVKIGLKLKEEFGPDPQDFCTHYRNTEPAPCMGAGYGGGNGPY